MKLEEFKKWFKGIETFQEEFEDANKAVSLLCKSSYPVFEIGTNLQDKYIDLLSEYIGDTEEWIPYYVFECNMGIDPKEVTTVNGKKIKLDSVEKLYEVIFS